eukprot:1289463-Amphidinium_carterae.2
MSGPTGIEGGMESWSNVQSWQNDESASKWQKCGWNWRSAWSDWSTERWQKDWCELRCGDGKAQEHDELGSVTIEEFAMMDGLHRRMRASGHLHHPLLLCRRMGVGAESLGVVVVMRRRPVQTIANSDIRFSYFSSTFGVRWVYTSRTCQW